MIRRALDRLAAACGYDVEARDVWLRCRRLTRENERLRKLLATAAQMNDRDWQRLTEQHAAAVADLTAARSALIRVLVERDAARRWSRRWKALAKLAHRGLTHVDAAEEAMHAAIRERNAAQDERDEAMALLRRAHSGPLGWFDERDALLAKAGGK